MRLEPFSLISVKEARKILGKDSRELSDGQVIDIITTLTLVARKFFDNDSSKKSRGLVD